jgi:hypothetical protein
MSESSLEMTKISTTQAKLGCSEFQRPQVNFWKYQPSNKG